MTTPRILEAKVGSLLIFREDLIGTQFYQRSPAPDLSAFEGQRFKVARVTAEGIYGQAMALSSDEELSPEILVGLDEDLFKLAQVSHPKA